MNGRPDRALRFALLLLLPLLPACGGARGRAAAARAACGIGASAESDPVARQLALARCDAQYESRLAQVERAEAYERQANHQRAQVHQARTQAEALHSSRLAAIRANPQAPELGATVREGEQLCARQHGRYSAEDDGWHVCRVGGRVLFGGRSGDTVLFHEVVTFFEGADSVSFRNTMTGRVGPPQDEHIVQGFRVWRWFVNGATLMIGGYEHGTFVGWASRSD